jgi:hypothetical protein
MGGMMQAQAQVQALVAGRAAEREKRPVMDGS